MKVIHVLRKPVSEGSVAQNVLKHGTGALNIDKSRIGTMDLVQNQAGHKGNPFTVENSNRPHTPRTYRSDGRWPANLILQHLDGCRCEGTTKIRAITGTRAGRHESRGWGMRGTGQPTGHGDTDGNETIANWICVEGCPVLDLDEQSGVTKGDKRAFTGGKVEKGVDGKGEDIYTAGWRSNTDIKGTCYAGAGGASRFFKQVKADEGD